MLSSTDRPPDCASALFGLLWDALADLLGTAATATLIRRAAATLRRERGVLAELAVERAGLAYTYRLPPSWLDPANPAALEELRILVRELLPLLAELTGRVAVRRLERVERLRAHGLLADA